MKRYKLEKIKSTSINGRYLGNETFMKEDKNGDYIKYSDYAVKCLHVVEESSMKWISVKDRLPNHEEHVIIFDNNKDVYFGYWVNDCGWYWYEPYSQDYNEISHSKVVYWMSYQPLPGPPESE